MPVTNWVVGTRRAAGTVFAMLCRRMPSALVGRVFGAVLPVLLVGVLASCAGQGGAEVTTTPTTTSSSAPASGAPSSAPSETSTAPSDTSATPAPSPTSSAASPEPSEPAGDRMTLSGTVRAGVEAGCLVLRDDGTLYLLLDDQDRMKPGEKVTVTGYVDKDAMSYCMQGKPFRVLTVTKP